MLGIVSQCVRNTPKILHNTRGEILQIKFNENDEKHDKSALMEIWQVFGTLSHADCKSVFCNNVSWTVV